MSTHTYESPDEAAPHRERTTYSWWWLTAAGAMALVLGLATLGGLWLLVRPLALLFLGVTFAEALAPVVAWLDRWIPRLLAVLLVYFVALLVLIGLVWLIVPPLASQVLMVAGDVPMWIEQVQEWLGEFDIVPVEDIVGNITSQLAAIGSAIVALPLIIATSVIDLLFLVFVSIYWLLSTPAMNRFVLSFFPRERHARIMSTLRNIGTAMGGYVRGSAIDGAIVGLLTYIGLSIIGIEFALTLGLLAGVLEVLPILGPVIAAIPMLILAFLNSPGQALIVLIFILALQQFEDRILVPIVMRSQTNVPPLLVLLAVYIGGNLAGLLGALVAIPLVSGLRVFVLEVIAPAIRRSKGVRPEGSLGEEDEIPEPTRAKDEQDEGGGGKAR